MAHNDLCIDQLEALNSRQQELHRTRAHIAELQFKLIQRETPDLIEEFTQVRNEIVALELQIKSLKIIIEGQDKVLDILDTIDSIERINPEKLNEQLVSLNNIYKDQLALKRDSIIEEFNKIIKMSPIETVCDVSQK